MARLEQERPVSAKHAQGGFSEVPGVGMSTTTAAGRDHVRQARFSNFYRPEPQGRTVTAPSGGLKLRLP